MPFLFARWILSDYSRETFVTSLFLSLNWLTLQQHRLSSTYYYINTIINNQLCTNNFSTMLSTSTVSHQTLLSRSSVFIVPQFNTNSQSVYSFYPRIIRGWNNFPVSWIEATSVDEFITLLSNQLATVLPF